ncbi:MAG: hypothetical protein JNJ46_07295 [Myxococcales bacterium]|nr:hypothetical protein [Myxococcales bacterium]
MTEGARKFMNTLAEKYVKAGYPHHNSWAFSPSSDEQVIFNELKARHYIRQLTIEMCVLTETGLAEIMENVPMSSGARLLLEDLKRQYVAAGYPQRRNWAFAPNEDGEEVAYHELRARGWIEQRTMALYVLSAAAQEKVMQGVGG